MKSLERKSFQYNLAFGVERFVSSKIGNLLKESAYTKLENDFKNTKDEDYQPFEELTFAELKIGGFKKYLNNNKPVIIRGFNAESEAVRNWSLDYFKENYANIEIPIRLDASKVDQVEMEARFVKMGEFIDSIKKGEANYAQNLHDIFNIYPKLYKAIDRDKSIKLLSKGKLSPKYSTQLFISNKVSRTFYHAAASSNLFTQIHGRKQWYMVDPIYTFAMKPVQKKDTFYYHSTIDWRKSTGKLRGEGFHLYNKIPKYRCILNPGDSLFVPQWWWHGVENLDNSIGVGVHAVNSYFQGAKTLALISLISPTMLAHILEILSKGKVSDKNLIKKVFKVK